MNAFRNLGGGTHEIYGKSRELYSNSYSPPERNAREALGLDCHLLGQFISIVCVLLTKKMIPLDFRDKTKDKVVASRVQLQHPKLKLQCYICDLCIIVNCTSSFSTIISQY
mmetsp:Transcript_12613/g.26725  ORF Transcript_12613/g.26725 Transcript_12613/m.26725 type:complete len:111 (+) Transcript_12613:907-1239(+)